jgi:ribosomal protein S18 acetylase RimI-like enzyme
MSLRLIQVEKDADIGQVEALAETIWNEYFTPIIGRSQVAYMLAKFQSRKAIQSQISTGYEYYLVQSGSEYVGYTALVPDNEKMMVSKLYTANSKRGQGVGKTMLNHIESKCVLENIGTIWLTVNKYNDSAIAWYKHLGFRIVDSVKADIGSGFFMDDYIMEKPVVAPE